MNALNSLSPSWTVDDFYFQINNVDFLRPLDVRDYECIYHGDRIAGVVTFLDMQNFIESTQAQVGGLITVGFTSQARTKVGTPANWKQTFSITSINQSNKGNLKSTSIFFEDTITRNLRGSFLSTSFNDKPHHESLEEFLGKLGMEGAFKIIPAIAAVAEKIDWQTPGNENALNILAKDFKFRGLSLSQDRHKGSAYIAHDSVRQINNAKHSGIFYEYKPRNTAQFNQVLEYNLEGYNHNALEQAVPTQQNIIHGESLGNKILNTLVTESIDVIGTVAGVDINSMITQRGQKQSNKNATISNISTQKSLKELQKMKIWVPGWAGNLIGLMVGVEIPRPEHFRQDESDESFTGNWQVKKVRDKLLAGTYYVQELDLIRQGEM